MNEEGRREIRLDLDLLSLFVEERNPRDVYDCSLGYSLRTYYRRLSELRDAGLLDWKSGKAKLTKKGLEILKILDHDRGRKSGHGGDRFILCSNDRIEDFTDDEFVFLEYPTASYLLNVLLLSSGVVKGRSNAEKLRELMNRDFKVRVAIANFENSSRQFLVFLNELIRADKIECLVVGVKSERKALSNKRILEFLEEHEFKNDKFTFSKDSVTLTPVLIFFVITYIVIVAYRFGFTFAPLAYFFIPMYFLRSTLFRELRNL